MSSTSWDPFARCTTEQLEQLELYSELLRGYNQKINLVSHEDIAFFRQHHLLHCLALTKKRFPDESLVIDWGTGGGLPAIPLAICFPKVTVVAVDAVLKKIQTVRAIGRKLGLKNLSTWHGRAGSWSGVAHYSVSRATASLSKLWDWHTAIQSGSCFKKSDSAWQPGLICLKGGNLLEETSLLQEMYPSVRVQSYALAPLLGIAYFAEKYIIEVTAGGNESTTN